MLLKRIIPNLLLKNGQIVKTKAFQTPTYIGDPCNTARIFNECEVDELILLDIEVSNTGKQKDFELIEKISSECFMPVSYGGGIQTLDDAKKIFSLGIEKIVVNSGALENPDLISKLSTKFGSQAIVVSIDYKQNWLGKRLVWSKSGNKRHNKDPISWAKEAEERGAGEILFTSIINEGSWSGFDVEYISLAASSINIPLVANGGGGSLKDVETMMNIESVSAISLGSMLVYQKEGMGVLVNFPSDMKRIIENESNKR